MITYEYDEETQILKFHFLGKITAKDLYENADTIKQHERIPKDAKLLAYADKADFVFTPEELKQFGQYVASGERKFNTVKEAFIVARPKETALTYIFGKSSLQIAHFKFKTFSTEEAALNWLEE
ncbi:MAG: STAS/SEC14 domain-containing protein [Bacteroidetes bacterium]|nr:STAS/SEC14 domain-containing protein [Bacteroidota bacterium]